VTFFIATDLHFEASEEYGVYDGDLDIVFDEEELEDSSDDEDAHVNGSGQTRSKELTATQTQQIYEALLERSNCGKLRKNTTKIVAELFNVNRHAVWRIWRRVKQCVLMDYQLISAPGSLLVGKKLKSTCPT
jgi:hypothetical protein